MTPERWHRVTALFHEALARDADLRAPFLEQACAGDPEIRGEVERLLAAHQRADRIGTADLVSVPDLDPNPETATESYGPDARSIEQAEPPRSVSTRHPFVLVVVLAAAFTAATFGSAAWLLLRDGGATKAFGWIEGRRGANWVVVEVDPGGPAAADVLISDRILALNGIPPLQPSGTRLQRIEVEPGDSYRLTLDRQRNRLERTLSVTEGPNALARRLAYFAISLVWCVVGVFIGIAQPARPAARLSFAGAVTTGLAFSQGAFDEASVMPLPITPLHVVLGLHFFARFPADRPVSGVWKWLLILAYSIAAVPLTLGWSVYSVWITRGSAEAAALVLAHQPLFAIRGPVSMYLFYASLVATVTLVASNYRALRHADERRRVRWVVYGSIAALTPQIVWSAAEIIVGIPSAAWMALPANLATVGIPLAVAYTVVRHRVLDISVVVRRSLQYLLARRALQITTAIPSIGLAATAVGNRHLTIAQLVEDTRGYLFWLAAAALCLVFRRPIETWIERRFFRQAYDREQLLLHLVDEVARIDSVPDLSRVIASTLTSALQPTTACIWYRDPAEHAAASSSDPRITSHDAPGEVRWLAWLEARGGPVDLPPPPEAGLSRAGSRWFRGRGISLVVPIIDSADRVIGALLLGDRRSEEPYTQQDRQLLAAVARQMAVVRENVRLRARVSNDARERHEVLARLDDRLPDLLKECPACGACFDGPVDSCPQDGTGLTLPLPIARTIDGKYRLDRRLGRGGMGIVYEARDLRLERSVAVKILLGRAFGRQQALRRFRREARAAAQLNHPNIVAVYDYGALAGEGAYLVMERVRGTTLRAVLEREGTLSPAAAADWFEQMLDGIAAAHARGIVHRDLKPENVMGVRDQAGLTVKMLDLGLAKVRADQTASVTLTAEGAVMGTLGYMAPEQLLGSDVDERADVFSIGVMLVEALSGEKPLQGDTDAEVLRRITHGEPLLPESLQHPRELRDLLLRCLAPDPERRVQAARLLHAELVPLLRRLQQVADEADP